MSPDENKALVQRVYDDVCNRGRLRLVGELIAGVIEIEEVLEASRQVAFRCGISAL